MTRPFFRTIGETIVLLVLVGIAQSSCDLKDVNDHHDDTHLYVSQWDIDHDRKLSYQEFYQSVRKSPSSHIISDEQVQDLFTKYDYNKDGFVTEEELKEAKKNMPRFPDLNTYQ